MILSDARSLRGPRHNTKTAQTAHLHALDFVAGDAGGPCPRASNPSSLGGIHHLLRSLMRLRLQPVPTATELVAATAAALAVRRCSFVTDTSAITAAHRMCLKLCW